MLSVKLNLLPKGHRNRPGYFMQPKGLLYHTTNNWTDGAGDEMHGKYMATTNTPVSWHDTVDKDSWTQHLPHNESGWHAGDGPSGRYNRNWLGLEIACEAVAPGQSLDKATYDNAVDAAAQIMMEFGWDTEDRLEPHNVVYGKDCPHHTLFDREQFEIDVLELVRERSVPSRISRFVDVSDHHWAVKYIEQAAEAGILSGYPDGTFRPDGSVTRAELAVVVARLLKLS